MENSNPSPKRIDILKNVQPFKPLDPLPYNSTPFQETLIALHYHLLQHEQDPLIGTDDTMMSKVISFSETKRNAHAENPNPYT